MNFKKIKTKITFAKISPFAAVSLALFLAGIFSFGVSKTGQHLATATSEKPIAKTVKKQDTSPDPAKAFIVSQSPQYTGESIKKEAISAPTQVPEQSYTTVTTTTSSTSQQNTTNSNQEKKVNLSINGGSSLDVKISEGINQCDVLTNALSQGKIQSLNMRYDNSLGSYAVYQINGIGQTNSVWWTYKVNGQSPSQGCSFVRANANDSIEWKYIGS